MSKIKRREPKDECRILSVASFRSAIQPRQGRARETPSRSVHDRWTAQKRSTPDFVRAPQPLRMLQLRPSLLSIPTLDWTLALEAVRQYIHQDK